MFHGKMNNWTEIASARCPVEPRSFIWRENLDGGAVALQSIFPVISFTTAVRNPPMAHPLESFHPPLSR